MTPAESKASAEAMALVDASDLSSHSDPCLFRNKRGCICRLDERVTELALAIDAAILRAVEAERDAIVNIARAIEFTVSDGARRALARQFQEEIKQRGAPK